jgi:hypothetical protein
MGLVLTRHAGSGAITSRWTPGPRRARVLCVGGRPLRAEVAGQAAAHCAGHSTMRALPTFWAWQAVIGRTCTWGCAIRPDWALCRRVGTAEAVRACGAHMLLGSDRPSHAVRKAHASTMVGLRLWVPRYVPVLPVRWVAGRLEHQVLLCRTSPRNVEVDEYPQPCV